MSEELERQQPGAERHSGDGPVALPPSRFYGRTDWISFGAALAVMLAVYVPGLAPDVTLEWSGIHATAAMYGSASAPPGYPLWSILGWVVIHLVPISNAAWRLALFSAVSGAMACGLIALMVSRLGAMIIRGNEWLGDAEGRGLRIVCGAISGIVLGRAHSMWQMCVIVETYALDVLIFAGVLALCMKWYFAPESNRALVAACFLYGLGLINSEASFTEMPGLLLLIVIRDPIMGREFLLALAGAIVLAFLADLGGLLEFGLVWWIHPFRVVLVLFASLFVVAGLGLIWKFPERRSCLKWTTACVLAVIAGAMLYLYMPVSAMTNPPVDWGYPRTGEGFWHEMFRGQFEAFYPTQTFGRFVRQVMELTMPITRQFGWHYLLIALISLLLVFRKDMMLRRWMMGMVMLCVLTGSLVLYGINPSLNDGAVAELIILYYLPVFALLATATGCGMIGIATWMGAPRQKSAEKE